jgi:polyphosphate kinase 2 (PPK2 family)
MKLSKVIKKARELANPYCITNGEGFRLKDIDPDDTGDLKSEDKPRAKEALGIGVEALATLQDMLYAQDRWAVLLIFQAMDGAGKDGAIKHVMSGVNPQGCQKHLPERGRMTAQGHRCMSRSALERVFLSAPSMLLIPPKITWGIGSRLR